MVQSILRLRAWLQRHSPLGEYGAAAIRVQLQAEQVRPLPCTRTIGRVLVRHNLLRRSRRRTAPPPPGWYLPALADGAAELDAFDLIEGLVIRHGPEAPVLNCIFLYGSLAACWPQRSILTAHVLDALAQHWRRFGRPHYAQFDNNTRFQGPHRHPERPGRVLPFCLCLGVAPVFVPPRETGFQAKIESYNNLWQQKVWQRWRHRSVPALGRRSEQFVRAPRAKHAPQADSAPARRAFPRSVPHSPAQPLVIFLRRTDAQGHLRLLQQSVRVDRHWPHRLVRPHLDVQTGQLHCYALRRRDPAWQPSLHTAHLDVKLSAWHRQQP